MLEDSQGKEGEGGADIQKEGQMADKGNDKGKYGERGGKEKRREKYKR